MSEYGGIEPGFTGGVKTLAAVSAGDIEDWSIPVSDVEAVRETLVADSFNSVSVGIAAAEHDS